MSAAINALPAQSSADGYAYCIGIPHPLDPIVGAHSTAVVCVQRRRPSTAVTSRSSWFCRVTIHRRHQRVRPPQSFCNACSHPLVMPLRCSQSKMPSATLKELLPPSSLGYFLTKIFHPNVSKAGEICVNTLKKDWKAEYGIGHVLQVVRCLLINPFPESALNEEAGKLFMEEYDAYFKKAQMMTEVHARTSAALTGEGPSGGGEGGPLEKRQKPVESKEAEKRRQEKKKSIKRL